MNLKSWLFEKATTHGLPVLNLPEKAKNYFTENISLWKEIYSGNCAWRYGRKGGIEGGTRKISAVNAAKALAAELSSLCFSQQIDFDFKNPEVKAFVTNVLQENNFWSCFPVFLEKMFAFGGGVIKTYLERGEVKLDFVSCDSFIPTQYDEKGIYGGIILSCINENNSEYLLCESHERKNSDYVIKNTLYKYDGRSGSCKNVKLSELYPDLSEEITISCLKKPLFVYFRPNSANNFCDGALGVSVFANSIDTLKSLDVIFDSLEREFVLGKKRIIVPTSAIRKEYDENGVSKRFFDTGDEVFQAFSADDNEELKILDSTQGLRVEEHLTAIEGLLDILCLQTGLSAGTLSYHNNSAKTATEVISQNSKTHRTKTAHQQLIREGLIDVFENIILLGVLSDQIGDPRHDTVVVFADSVMQDNSSRIDNAIKLYSSGIISKERAFMEVYGLSEEEVLI